MTDNEIIKALECCIGWKSCKEKQCPMINECEKDIDASYKQALDLINRQKAEIERLKPFEDKIAEFNSHTRVEDMLVFASSLEKWLEFCDNLKAEAIKDFAERLKETKFKHGNDYIIYADNIDNLVKEMVGDGE